MHQPFSISIAARPPNNRRAALHKVKFYRLSWAQQAFCSSLRVAQVAMIELYMQSKSVSQRLFETHVRGLEKI